MNFCNCMPRKSLLHLKLLMFLFISGIFAHSAFCQEVVSQKTIRELTGILESSGDKFLLESPFRELSHSEPKTEEDLDLLISCIKNKNRMLSLAASQALANVRNTDLAPKVISMLSDDNPGVVSAALDAIPALKDNRAVPAVLELLSREEGIAAKAGAALARMGCESAIPILLSRSPVTGGPIAASLARFGRPALQAVLSKLERSNKQERLRFIPIIELIEDKRAIADLNNLLAYPEAKVRGAAACALARMGELNTAEALKNPDPEVRIQALKCCTKIEGTKINKQLISIFEGDPDIQVRICAAQVISRRNITEAVPLLKKLLRHKNPEIRAAAEQALAGMGTDLKD